MVGEFEGRRPGTDRHDAVEDAGLAQILGRAMHDGLAVRGDPAGAAARIAASLSSSDMVYSFVEASLL